MIESAQNSPIRINAYILAADPEWITPSVLSYYQIIDKLFVSFDGESKGWTGVPVQVQSCLDQLRLIDPENKIVLIDGSYSSRELSPGDAETAQRQAAVDVAGDKADWILQVDTDEIVPDAQKLRRRLVEISDPIVDVVEWPMSSYFSSISTTQLLEVCNYRHSRPNAEAVPLAVRPRTKLKIMRYGRNPLRLRRKPPIQVKLKETVERIIGRRVVAYDQVPDDEVILHFSWVRSEAGIHAKVRSWGHASDFNAQTYVDNVWKKAPEYWKTMRDLHPIWPKLWPAIRPVSLSSLGLTNDLQIEIARELKRIHLGSSCASF